MSVSELSLKDPRAAHRGRPRRLLTYTVQAWLLATSPLWITGAVWVVQLLIGTDRLPGSITLFIGMLLTVALTVRDRTRLVASGHQNAASVGWSLLSPIAYLVARATRVSGWAPAVTCMVLAMLVVVVLALTGGSVQARP